MLSIVLPVAGVVLAFALGDRYVRLVAFAVMPLGLAVAVAILLALPQNDGHLVYLLGGWVPPLGVALRADGLSAVMIAATAVVISAVAIYGASDFRPAAAARAPAAFWILLLAIWGALNTIFVGGDLFTLYVALELLTFAAVPLVSLDGRSETLQAALRYLLFALLGSVLYLAGTALLYGLYGTLDVVLLSRRANAQPGTLIAAALMTTGLLAKTALVPLHLWLPSAHAGAPATASAILSGLVVKGSFFIIARLWFQLMPALPGFAATQLLGALGATAIVLGSFVALRQERLKLLIAYSTLAQIGYLFLMFPLALDASDRLEAGDALAGGMLQTITHAMAKAAMFMASGSIYAALGHDRVAGLGGVARALPLSTLAFAFGGIALMGVQPSGASVAKDLLLQAAAEKGQWWWAIVLQASGIFTAAYVVLVLAHAFAPSPNLIALSSPVPRIRDLAPLVLAFGSLLLGLVPFGSYLPAAYDTAPSGLNFAPLSKAIVPVFGGTVLAFLARPGAHSLASPTAWRLVMRPVCSLREGCIALGDLIEQGNDLLCRWPTASISLLSLAVLFSTLMLATV
ncbi:proton-conducting transporter membrane subunit [Bradyrhizobium sp. UFLA05-109]